MLTEIYVRQKEYFLSGETRNIAYRIDKLIKLKELIKEYEKDILDSLNKDLGKSHYESYLTEVGMVLNELSYYIKNLRKWAKPDKVKTPIYLFSSKSRIYKEPYGVTLIIAPWNYPFQLSILPLVASVAAGNCVIVKPSKESLSTLNVINKIINQCFDQKHVYVFDGDDKDELLSLKYDYIFFTGGIKTGKIIYEKAAKDLTPVTLELGGKSPCIVDETADINMAAKKIAWGKLINAGQTCVAPDYVLVHKSLENDLVAEMNKYIEKFYGDALNNNKYGCVINYTQFDRLISLSDNIVYSRENRKIQPLILTGVDFDSRIMQEEIFGPILPVIPFDNLNDVVNRLNTMPKPLALYLFTQNKKNERYILNNISFGGGCINDTIMHLANIHLPFGGVGESGIGSYHGKAGFDTFTHKKSILKSTFDIPIKYPPYPDNYSLIKKFMN